MGGGILLLGQSPDFGREFGPTAFQLRADPTRAVVYVHTVLGVREFEKRRDVLDVGQRVGVAEAERFRCLCLNVNATPVRLYRVLDLGDPGRRVPELAEHPLGFGGAVDVVVGVERFVFDAGVVVEQGREYDDFDVGSERRRQRAAVLGDGGDVVGPDPVPEHVGLNGASGLDDVAHTVDQVRLGSQSWKVRRRGITVCGSPAKGNDRWRRVRAQDTPNPNRSKSAGAWGRPAAVGYTA